jgi:hypothetical protein
MYTITQNEIEQAKLLTTAAILNNVKELEYTLFLQTVTNEYTGQLNKRFETYLNKALAETYGTYEYKYYDEPNTPNYCKASEYDKTINNVSAYLSSETYSVKYFKLTVSYIGTEMVRDYDAKEYKLGKRNQSLQFYTWETLDDLKQQLTNKIKYINNDLIKIKENQKHLDKFAREHNTLVEQIKAYNDKISYTIADTYRIK